MQYKILITAACLMAAIASPVAAADPRSPQKREWPPAYAAEPLRYNWSGFYAGVHAGGAFDKYTGTTKKSRNETVFGGQVGYNFQSGNMVYGLESEFSANGAGNGSAKGTGTRADLRYLGTAKARAGFAMDRTLVYATGGLAYGSLKATNALRSDTKQKLGYLMGAGIEYGITNNLSAKVEYNYVSLGKQTFQLGSTRAKVGATEHLVKAGLNYRF